MRRVCNRLRVRETNSDVALTLGFDTSYRYDFDIIGKKGETLQEHHTPHPRTYMSVAVDGFPNMFQALGPNAGVGAGNLLLIMERQVDYAVSATLKIQRERIKSMDVKPEAVDDFETWIEVSLCLFFFKNSADLRYLGQSYFPKVSSWPNKLVLKFIQWHL